MPTAFRVYLLKVVFHFIHLTHASAADKSGAAFAQTKDVILLAARCMHWLGYFFGWLCNFYIILNSILSHKHGYFFILFYS